VAVEGQRARERVAIGGVARVPDVRRPGRVGRDELHDDPFGVRRRARAELLACRQRSRQRARQPGIGDEQV
jgi:hypothetical protein